MNTLLHNFLDECFAKFCMHYLLDGCKCWDNHSRRLARSVTIINLYDVSQSRNNLLEVASLKYFPLSQNLLDLIARRSGRLLTVMLLVLI